MREARWGRIALFLILVFALSWSLGILFDGDGVPPLGMFVPALVAIFMRTASRAHWVFRGFVLLFVVQLLMAVLAVSTSISGSVLGGLATWSMIGWTLLVIRLYRSKGEESFAEGGLQLGDRHVGLKIAIGFVLRAVAGAIAIDVPWTDWFVIHDWPLHPYDAVKPANYGAWWGLKALPTFNTDNPHVREYRMRVAEHWAQQGIDGWRLDVPDTIRFQGDEADLMDRHQRAADPAADQDRLVLTEGAALLE